MDPVYVLASHVSLFKTDQLPDRVMESTKRFVLDHAGVSIAGSSGTGCREVAERIIGWGGKPESTVIVYGVKIPSIHAAFVNGLFGHARELDDGHEDGGIHCYSSVLPAALAVAESEGPVTGRDFLAAVALGVDLNARLALSIRYNRGWHLTGICGTFGAAAAAGKILGLDEEKMRHALGIAYCQTAGIGIGSREAVGTKRLTPAASARTGVMAAYFAKDGIIGPTNTFEGKEGFFSMFDGDWHDEKAFRYKMDGSPYDRVILTEGLGEKFEGENLYMKFFPSCRFTQAPIQAALQAVSQRQISPENVKRVRVFVCERSMKFAGPFVPGGHPEMSAQFNIRYLVAAAIVRKRFFLDCLEPEAVLDPRILELAAKVDVIHDPAIKLKVPVTVEIETLQGETVIGRTEQIKGNPLYPLTNDEVMEKFCNCVNYSAHPFTADDVAALIDTITHLDELSDVRLFSEKMVPKAIRQIG